MIENNTVCSLYLPDYTENYVSILTYLDIRTVGFNKESNSLMLNLNEIEQA